MGTPDNLPLTALHDLSDDTVLSTNMKYYSICISAAGIEALSSALCRLRSQNKTPFAASLSRQDADLGRPSTSVVPSV
jgi:hypothetical protein